MRRIVPILLFFISTHSFGEGINLVCVDKNNSYTMNLTFDEKNQTVTVANRTIKAKINQDEIVYRETGVDNRVYVSKLSRSTGNLQVYEMTNSSSNSIIDSTYQCSVRNKKF